MLNLNIIFYDKNIEYIYRLRNFFSEKYSEYNIIYFTNDSKFKNFCKGFKGQGIFIISECCMSDVIQPDINGEILILVDEDNVILLNNYSTLYRYQASDNLISSILNYYAEKATINSNKKYIVKDNCQIIGIYSPINKCGKTNLSVELAKSLEKDVLLINLEEFSDLMDRLNIESDFTISDLMYFFLKNKDNLSIKLDAIVKEYKNFYIMPPLDNPEDLYDIETDIWVRLFLSISNIGKYKYIVLDISNVVRYFIKLFDICSYIFIPYSNEKSNSDKLKKFDTYISSKSENGINDKMYRICMENKTIFEAVNEIQTIMKFLRRKIWRKI